MTLTPDQLDLTQLAATIERFNTAYRAGAPEVSDEVYDHVWMRALRERAPDHPLLGRVEPEQVGVMGAPVRHSTPLKSTEKAYEQSEVDAWIKRVAKSADEIGVDPTMVVVVLMPKLDGLAGFWDGQVLATRGDGVFGQDVTRNLARGLVLDRSVEGAGELVIVQSYFEEHIAEQFDMAHSRNLMVGLVGADTLKPHHEDALKSGVCRFVPYSTLPHERMSLDALSLDWKSALERLRTCTEYLTDGVVVEVSDARLRDHMGATGHHHRWMLALKTKGDVAQTSVAGITLQVGRTGRCTPVIECEPVQLSGATIRRCTAHTARHVERLGLGPGAKITLVRSGEVVPALVSVEQPSATPVDMSKCPCCGAATAWDNDYLICPNTEGCPAQASARLEHFFKRMGINGFGPKVCEQLAAAGHLDPVAICAMDVATLVAAGISVGIAANLVSAIAERKGQVVKDNDAVASFGARHLGRGDARHLLEVHQWSKLGELTAADVAAIPGFGAHTAGLIAPHLAYIGYRMVALAAQGFQIEATIRAADVGESPIKGKKLVFTGTMPQPRDAMEQRARELGATIQSGVSSTTDLLVIGDKAGSKKAKAEQLGVRILPVDDYLSMLGAQG